MDCPQVVLGTSHIFHAGMYARTLWLPAGAVISSAQIKIPTLLIVQGDCRIYTPERYEVCGYAVLAGEAGRKAIFKTEEGCSLTMIFTTKSRTVEEAEREFTADHEKLMSRKSTNDTVVVTGE